MPSRLPSTFTSSLSQCIPAARSQCTSHASHQLHARNFSRSCRNEQTALRRAMYDWLNGPGAKLRHPLPGSTNYLGAYDKQGNLLRATAMPTRIREDGEEGKEEEPSDGGLESRIDSADKGVDAVDNELPRENRTDLTPFPLNKQFYSQPVLSEELRERIYKAVVEEKLPLPIASTSYKVSMERVAAVVRLKTMERQ